MGFHFLISREPSYIGTKITAPFNDPFNGVVSFILYNRKKFGRSSDRGYEADLWIMDYGFLYMESENKTRKKVVLASDYYWDYFSLCGLSKYCRIIPVLMSWSVV